MIPFWIHPLTSAASKGLVSEVKRVIETDNSLKPLDLTEAAAHAVQYNHIDVLPVLLDAGWDVNIQEDRRGSTILGYSLRSKTEHIAVWLVEHGADVNTADESGVVPLAHAAKWCSIDMVRTLLKHGARIPGSGSLAAAAVSKEPERVEKLDLLIQHGAEIDEMVLEFPFQTQSGRRLQSGTALHAACKWGFEDSEAYLLEHGADPELKTTNGFSLDDLKRRQSSLNCRGWSFGMVSSTAKRRLAERERKRKEEEQAQAQAQQQEEEQQQQQQSSDSVA